MGLRYEDYVKQQNENDPLQKEIEDAAQATETRREIPDSVVKRFDGKSIEDVLEAYANAENKISEQGQTIGQLRQASDQLLELQLLRNQTPAGDDTTESVPPLTVDSLYDDPEKAITEVVKRETSEQRKELQVELALLKQERVKANLTEQYPTWSADSKSPEFISWAQESPYRLRLAQAADQFDIDAASDLLELWYAHNGRTQELHQEQERSRQLDEATLESASPEGFEPEEAFSRLDLMQKRIASKQGNREAEEWLRVNGPAINLAYAEGRISD